MNDMCRNYFYIKSNAHIITQKYSVQMSKHYCFTFLIAVVLLNLPQAFFED